MTKTYIITAVLVVLLLLGLPVLYVQTQSAEPLVIDVATFHITSPLTEDGLPDYAAVLNAEASQGVTPDNNAVVLLVQALGAETFRMDDDNAAEYFRLLGIPPVDDTLVAWESWDDYARRTRKEPAFGAVPDPTGDSGYDWEAAYNQLEQAQQRPWTAEETPDLAHWLAEQENTLALIIGASQRQRFYVPISSADRLSNFPSLIFEQRVTAGTLRARAMLRIASGDTDGAWEDMLACQRLGRLIRQQGSLVGVLVGCMLEIDAMHAQSILFEHSEPSEIQVRRWRSDLVAIGSTLRLTAAHLGRSERLSYLSSLCSAAKNASDAELDTGEFNPVRLKYRSIDWHIPLLMVNDWFDRAQKIAAIDDPIRFAPAFTQLQLDFGVLVSEVTPLDEILPDFLRSRLIKSTGEENLNAVLSWAYPQISSKLMGHEYVTSMLEIFRLVYNLESRTRIHHELSLVALALSKYKTLHGVYPADLDDLVPECLSKVPLDPFTNSALIYVPHEEGYQLYSVGPNGMDERGNDAENSLGNADDVVVSVPSYRPKPLPVDLSPATDPTDNAEPTENSPREAGDEPATEDAAAEP